MADDTMKDFFGNFNKRFEEQFGNKPKDEISGLGGRIKPTSKEKKEDPPKKKPLFDSNEEDFKIPRFSDFGKTKESKEE